MDAFEALDGRGGAAREIGRQYLRSATSIGANYAEAAAGQTKADFIAKVAIARKECREALFWLRLMQDKSMLPSGRVTEDLVEATQLAAILTAIIRKARASSARGEGKP